MAKSIHSLIREQVGLAKTYADDGAFHTAASVLRRLADSLEAHASACDAALSTVGPRLGGAPKFDAGAM